MGGIDAHHGKGLARAGLAICEDGAVIALKTVGGAFLSHLEEHILLGVVIGNGVKGEFFVLVGVKGLNGMSVVFDIDAYTVILLLLSEIGRKVLLGKRSDTNSDLNGLLILGHFA